jgi:phytoene desaturase
VRNLLLLFRLRILTRHYENIGNYFDDAHLKAAFTFQDMYLGDSPYEVPAVFSLLQYTELAHGVWFPTGGMYRVIEALRGIAEKWGVRFMVNAPVHQIDVTGRKATGVTLADGRPLAADIVVANADLPYVYRCLLPEDGMAGRLARKRFSCSTLMFYWGISRPYPQLQPHNLFLAGDFCAGLNRILHDLDLPDEPSFYLHAPARIDPAAAPEGQDTLMVAVPVGHIDDAAPQHWPTIQARARQSVLQRLAQVGIADLDEHIKFEVCYTPRDWQGRLNLTKGSSHGLRHRLSQMAYLRPHNRHRRYRNLYFVGSGTHPGTGLPTVLVSARLTSERILQDVGLPGTIPEHVPATTSFWHAQFLK